MQNRTKKGVKSRFQGNKCILYLGWAIGYIMFLHLQKIIELYTYNIYLVHTFYNNDSKQW